MKYLMNSFKRCTKYVLFGKLKCKLHGKKDAFFY